MVSRITLKEDVICGVLWLDLGLFCRSGEGRADRDVRPAAKSSGAEIVSKTSAFYVVRAEVS